jgi:hypothetical protein
MEARAHGQSMVTIVAVQRGSAQNAPKTNPSCVRGQIRAHIPATTAAEQPLSYAIYLMMDCVCAVRHFNSFFWELHMNDECVHL